METLFSIELCNAHSVKSKYPVFFEWLIQTDSSWTCREGKMRGITHACFAKKGQRVYNEIIQVMLSSSGTSFVWPKIVVAAWIIDEENAPRILACGWSYLPMHRSNDDIIPLKLWSLKDGSIPNEETIDMLAQGYNICSKIETISKGLIQLRIQSANSELI